jgi:hypothetical protein
LDRRGFETLAVARFDLRRDRLDAPAPLERFVLDDVFGLAIIRMPGGWIVGQLEPQSLSFAVAPQKHDDHESKSLRNHLKS